MDRNPASPTDGTRVMPDDLREWVVGILRHQGANETAASVTAEALIEANLAGVFSQGVGVKLPHYLELLDRRTVEGGSEVRVVARTPGTALLDAGNNLGPVGARAAVDLLVPMTREQGSAWVGVRHSNHIGCLAVWCRRIVEHDMIGIVMANAAPDMAVHGSLGKAIGVNPIAFGAPGPEFPVVLDVSSSATAMGNVRKAAMNRQAIPAHWGMDRDGRTTTDPQAVIDGGAVLPMNGHKGGGLAILIDILAGVLVGASFSTQLRGRKRGEQVENLGHLFGAIRVDGFCPMDQFNQRVGELVDTLHGLPPHPDIERVLLPGERSHATATRQRREGIALSAEVSGILRKLADDYGYTRLG